MISTFVQTFIIEILLLMYLIYSQKILVNFNKYLYRIFSEKNLPLGGQAIHSCISEHKYVSSEIVSIYM